VFHGATVIAVSHVAGMHEANVQEFDEENRKDFESNGGVVLTIAHSFSGLSAAVRNN
jgi:hypothetical protein